MWVKKSGKSKKVKASNKFNENSLAFSGLNKAAIKPISLWKVFSLFAILSLVGVNVINYWQPINHNDLREYYEQRQQAILTAHDLQYYITEFKKNPDQHAFNIIQQSVKLNSDIEKIKKFDSSFEIDSINNINNSVEKIVASIPSINFYQKNIEKIARVIDDFKYKVMQPDRRLGEVNQNVLITIDKIQGLVQKLKYEHWTDPNLINHYQANIEEIGQEIEQLNIKDTQLDSRQSAIIMSVSDIFNDLNSLMPEVFQLSDVANKLEQVETYQAKIISDIKAQQINYTGSIDDKTIIMLTIFLANLLLLVLVVLTKISEQTKKVYNNIKHKKEVYYLSHIKDENSENNVYSADDKSDLGASVLSGAFDIPEHFIAIKHSIINDCSVLQNTIAEIDKDLGEQPIMKCKLIILEKIIARIKTSASLLEKANEAKTVFHNNIVTEPQASEAVQFKQSENIKQSEELAEACS